MYKYELLYTCGANYKTRLKVATLKKLKVGAEITTEELTGQGAEEFVAQYVGDYDPEHDHNILEVVAVLPDTTADIDLDIVTAKFTVTRVTIYESRMLSADLTASKENIALSVNTARIHARAYNYYLSMLETLQSNPSITALDLFAAVIPEAKPTQKDYTKKRRTFSGSGFTITEEII